MDAVRLQGEPDYQPCSQIYCCKKRCPVLCFHGTLHCGNGLGDIATQSGLQVPGLLRQSCDRSVVGSTGTPRPAIASMTMSGGMTAIGAISAYHLLLLWASLCCIHAKTCANGCQRTAHTYRSGRQLQAMTLVAAPQSSSGGGLAAASLPVNGTIYGNSFEPGWAVLSLGSGGVRQQQVVGAVNNSSKAFCATLPSSGDEIYFNCQNCSQIGYGPFELNKTSGFQLTVRHTRSDYSPLAVPSQATLPDIQIKLGNDSLEPSQCNFGINTYGETFSTERNLFIIYGNDLQVNSTRNDSTGVFTRRHLFQYYQACMPTAASLANVTSIGFSSNIDNVSFCIEDFHMLPSQVATSGALASASPATNPRSENCVTMDQTLFPVDQDGRFLALGQDKAAGHSVLGSSPSTGYTVFPGVDAPSNYNFAPVNSTCSSNRTAPNVTDVNSCSNYNSGLGICCLDAGPYTKAFGSAQLPEELANICNGLTINGIVCQGFSYGSDGTFVTFKGQQPDDALNMADNACNSPNNTFWALNAALNNLTESDVRPIAMPPSPPPPPPAPPSPPPTPPPPPNGSTNSKVGTAWGVVAAVVGPSTAVATWFLLTWYYRSEKKIIINEVIRRLKVSDICKVDSAVQYTSAGASTASQARQAKRSSAFHSGEYEREPSLVADMVRSGSFTSAVSAASDLEGTGMSEVPTPELRRVAAQMTRRCLRRWDGLLGIRAYSDSLGNRAGIWRDRFDTVRCAVLLLAFKKLNQALQANPRNFREDCPGSLMAAWQSSSSHGQKREVISWISKKVQEITEDDAQALHDRDPDHPGFYDEMCNKMTCCDWH